MEHGRGDWACWKNPCPTTQATTVFVMEFAGRNDGTIWSCGRRNLSASLPPPGYQQEPDKTVIDELTGYARKWINWQCAYDRTSVKNDHDNHNSVELLSKGRAFRPTTPSGLPTIDQVSTTCLCAGATGPMV